MPAAAALMHRAGGSAMNLAWRLALAVLLAAPLAAGILRVSVGPTTGSAAGGITW